MNGLPSSSRPGGKPDGGRLSSLQTAHVIPETLITGRRNLPHWQMGGRTYFITFRLYGVPERIIPLSVDERAKVKDAVLFWHAKKWRVHALTVMPNHAHLLATPSELAPGTWYSLSSILQSVKGYSARSINASRGTKGQLWQSESFDRIVRDATEYTEKATYILNNAVKAGLVADGWAYDGFWCDTGGDAG